MTCTRHDVAFALSIVSRYQGNPGRAHQTAVKNILKYRRRTKDWVFTLGGSDLRVTGYSDRAGIRARRRADSIVGHQRHRGGVCGVAGGLGECRRGEGDDARWYGANLAGARAGGIESGQPVWYGSVGLMSPLSDRRPK